MILLIIMVAMIISLSFFRTMESRRKYRLGRRQENRQQKLNRLLQLIKEDDELN